MLYADPKLLVTVLKSKLNLTSFSIWIQTLGGNHSKIRHSVENLACFLKCFIR